MELPRPLREAIDRHLEGISLGDLESAAARLSGRYRAETRDGCRHIESALSAKAYLATRLPATYVAVRGAMASIAARRPDFAPARLLDFGAGPATAAWAAHDSWPGMAHADLIEQSGDIRAAGASLAEALPVSLTWHSTPITPSIRPELVTVAYVLDEIEPALQMALIDRLWSATSDVLLIVEPGTSNGWQRILAARDRLLTAGAHILAPCPHALACPLAPPDWCHFSQRLARSRMHRQAKNAEVPWEDEKFIYLAVSRKPGLPAAARVIAPPQQAKGRVTLKLCKDDGNAEHRLVSKRESAAYKIARRADWGDTL
ncbi:small ribosomal subunit Rsm22 family protein [soil metagenome]